jgi:DNA-directed RNA polymerase subunit RPC12/RpoP
MGKDKMLCPKCGTRTMAKVRLPDGKYTLRCERCGLERGEFKPDRGRGVV